MVPVPQFVLSPQLAPSVASRNKISASRSVCAFTSFTVTCRVSSGSVPWPSPMVTVREYASSVLAARVEALAAPV